MKSIFSRQVTYIKYILTPSFARPLNAILAAIIMMLLVYVMWTWNDAKTDPYKLNFSDYVDDRIPKQVEWEKYVMKWAPEELVQFDMTLTHREKCPACFGDDMCSRLENGEVKVDLKGTPKKLREKGVYLGRWSGVDIVVKTLVGDEKFKYYDEYVCNNVTGSASCNVAKEIVNKKSLVVQDGMLNPHFLARAYEIGHGKPPTISTLHCASSDLISKLASPFDKNKDGALQPDERATFFTSFALNPEATIFRGARKMLVGYDIAQEAFHGPKFYGACGRVVVHQNVGVPVSSLLEAPWELRVDLAISILALVGQLEASDLRWYFVYGDFQLQNFAVDQNGFVSIIDAKEIGVVDLDKNPPPLPEDKDDKDPCNEECFTQFTKPLADPALPDSERGCDMITFRAGHMMNSFACRMLSDLPEHREPGRRYRGLLHGAPKIDDDQINTLLKECVEETNAGGRDNAINSLYSVFDYMMTRSDEDDGDA